MSQINLENIDRFMEERKFDEARSAIKDFFLNRIDEKEASRNLGGMYLKVAQMYIKLNQAMLDDYLSDLTDISETLKQYESKDREVNDKVGIATVKSQINNL